MPYSTRRARKKGSRLSSHFIKRLASWLVLSTALTLGPSKPAHAATLYWDGTGPTWNAQSDWSTTSGTITPAGAVPGSADIATFNTSILNSPQTITLDANQAALGLVFNSTGTVSIATGGGTNTLTIGTSGIAVNSGSGADTI